MVCSEPATFLLERWWEPRDKPQASEARGVTWAVRSWSAERLKLEFRGVHPGRVRVDLRGVNSAESWSDEPLEGEPGFLRRIHLFSGGLTEEAEIRVTVWQEVERYDFEFLAEGLRVE